MIIILSITALIEVFLLLVYIWDKMNPTEKQETFLVDSDGNRFIKVNYEYKKINSCDCSGSKYYTSGTYLGGQ